MYKLEIRDNFFLSFNFVQRKQFYLRIQGTKIEKWGNMLCFLSKSITFQLKIKDRNNVIFLSFQYFTDSGYLHWIVYFSRSIYLEFLFISHFFSHLCCFLICLLHELLFILNCIVKHWNKKYFGVALSEYNI